MGLNQLHAQEMFPVWASTLGGEGWDIARSMCVTPNGDIIIAGTFDDTITIDKEKYTPKGNRDVYLARYNANGKYLGSAAFGGEGPEIVMHTAYDKSLVMGLRVYKNTSIQDKKFEVEDKPGYLLCWFDDNFNLNQSKLFTSTEKLEVSDMKIGDQNKIYLTGWFSGTLQSGGTKIKGDNAENAFLAIINKKGSRVILSQLKVGENTRFYSCNPKKGNKIDITGITYPEQDARLLNEKSNKRNTLFIAEANNSGKIYNVSTLINGPEIEPVSIKTRKKGSWVASRYKYYCLHGKDTINAMGQNDILLLSVSDKNIVEQVQSIGGYGNDIPMGLETSGEQVVLSGSYSDTIWFDKKTYQVADKMGSDLFIATYDEDYTPLKTISIGDTYNDFPCDVITNDAGVYMLGQYKEAFQAGKEQFTTRGSYDVFVARFENCGAKEEVPITIDTYSDSKGEPKYQFTAGDGYYSYKWDNGIGWGQTVSVKNINKTYTVEATDQYGCICKGTVEISNLKSATIATNNGDPNAEIKETPFLLYPTITSGKVYWQAGSNYPANGAIIRVYDNSGKTVLSKPGPKGITATEANELNLANLIGGQYIVEVIGEGYNESIKIIVK
jgi:hypothetical protein